MFIATDWCPIKFGITPLVFYLLINEVLSKGFQFYYVKLADQLKSDNLSNKEWWKIFKKVTGLKNKSKSTYPPIILDENSTSMPVNENYEKANLFNSYFCQQSQVNDTNTE